MAFNELSTCRHQGPIPWVYIIEYGCYYRLDRELIDVLISVISKMDRALLKWQEDEREQQRRAAKRQTPRTKH